MFFYNEKKKKKNKKTKLEKKKTHFTSSGSHSFAGTHAANKHWCFLLVVAVGLLFPPPPPPPSLRSIDPRHESEEARIVFFIFSFMRSEDIFFSAFWCDPGMKNVRFLPY